MNVGKCKVKIEVFDENGELVKKHEQEGNSWLSNFYIWFSLMMQLGITRVLVDETGATYRYGGAITYTWDENLAARTHIAIGTSDELWDINQYKLGAKYAQAVVDASDVDVYGKKVTFSAGIRVTSDVVIKETGVLFYLILESTGAGKTVLIERTVLDAPISVKAYQTVRINYVVEYA